MFALTALKHKGQQYSETNDVSIASYGGQSIPPNSHSLGIVKGMLQPKQRTRINIDD